MPSLFMLEAFGLAKGQVTSTKLHCDLWLLRSPPAPQTDFLIVLNVFYTIVLVCLRGGDVCSRSLGTDTELLQGVGRIFTADQTFPVFGFCSENYVYSCNHCSDCHCRLVHQMLKEKWWLLCGKIKVWGHEKGEFTNPSLPGLPPPQIKSYTNQCA